jgi:lipoprotein-releasing system permease protein
LLPCSSPILVFQRRILFMTRLIWLLARSHLRRRRTQNLISIVGVAIGVMVLTTALSLTNGFVKTLIDTTIKAQPHITLQAWDQEQGGTPTDPKLEQRLSSNKEVVGWSRYVFTQALLTRRASSGKGGSTGFAEVYGVDTKREAGALNLESEDRIQLGQLPPDGILLGYDLARSMRLIVGDTIYVVATKGLDISSAVKKKFRFSGTFRTRNYQIDSVFGFVGIQALQSLMGLGQNIMGYHVRLSDAERAIRLANTLPLDLEPGKVKPTNFYGRPWQDINQTLIAQMQLQKNIISIVLLLIVIVAAFGIVNVLVLTVFEKTPEIAILRAMGAKASVIQQVFLLEGFVLGFLGMLLGNLLGFILSLYFTLYPYRLPGDLYFITALPAQMKTFDFVWVSVASLLTTLVAGFIPARRAANIQPARIIR